MQEEKIQDMDVQEKKIDNKKMRVGMYSCLAVLIVLQLAVIVYCFQFKKEGYHSDEMWSYGYANSYNQKDIYQDADGNPLNVGMWTSSDVLRDYLVVNEGEEFEYGSIYRNQIDDLSPPFHSMVLHTICSFFPESFSPWYSFAINIVSFIICMIFLFKACCILMDDKQALLVCLVYGFCRAAIDNFCYLRMYALCTAFVMIILYYVLSSVKGNRETSYWKIAVPLFIVSVLAFLTHYYMVAIGGIMTALFCAYLLCTKQIKRMFQLGFTMLGAFITSVAIFPSLLLRSQSQANKIAGDNAELYNYTFEIRGRILWNFITSKTCGIQISIFRSAWPKILLGCMVYACILMIPLVFLLRKTTFIQNIKNQLIYLIKNFRTVSVKGIKWILAKTNWCYVIIFITCALQVVVVGETSSVYGMGNFEDRYIFYLSPLFVIAFMAVINKILEVIFRLIPKLKKARYVLLGLFSFWLVYHNLWIAVQGSNYYFTTGAEGERIELLLENQNVVYLDQSTWLLTAMCPVFMNSREYLMIEPKGYKEHAADYKEKMDQGPLYLMINESDYESNLLAISEYVNMDKDTKENIKDKDEEYYDILDYFEKLDPDTEMTTVSRQVIMDRWYIVFCVNPEKK